MSLLGYLKVILYTKFEHYGNIRFWVVIRTLVWKMHLLVINPVTLTFDLSIPNPRHFYSKIIPYTKFENFKIIRFWVMLWTNRQTNRRTRKSYPRLPTDAESPENLSLLTHCPVCYYVVQENEVSSPVYTVLMSSSILLFCSNMLIVNVHLLIGVCLICTLSLFLIY